MKRVVTVLLTICLCFVMTGCGVTDAFNAWKAGVANDSLVNEIAKKNAEGTWSAETKEAWSEMMDASAKLDAAHDEKWYDGIWFGIGDHFKNQRISKAQSNLTFAKLKADQAELNDPLRNAELADERDRGNNQDKGILGKNTTKVIIIVVILLAVVLLLFLLNKRSKPVVRPVAPVKPSKPALELDSEVTGLPDHSHLPQVNASTMNACRKLAEKLGLDADVEIQKYDGDADKLYMSLTAMTPLD